MKCAYFEECVRFYETNSIDHSPQSIVVSSDAIDHRPSTIDHVQDKNSTKLIHDALVCGIQNYFQKLGFKKAIWSLSGGIDSALTLVLAVRALGRENVLSVLMPSQFSTSHSVEDSLKLVENLDSPYKIIPIKVFDVYDKMYSAF
ncbi:MAG: hypothetical protein U0T77_03495 [Chitinophagales bacterium]